MIDVDVDFLFFFIVFIDLIQYNGSKYGNDLLQSYSLLIIAVQH